MSADNSKDEPANNKVIPFCSLLFGVVMLYLGNDQYQLFLSEAETSEPFYTPGPDNQTIWLLIIGASIFIAGFLGLLRNKIL